MNKEYFAVLKGKRIDCNGFFTNYGVTANTKKEAARILAKAKKYYFGTYKVKDAYISSSN